MKKINHLKNNRHVIYLLCVFISSLTLRAQEPWEKKCAAVKRLTMPVADVKKGALPPKDCDSKSLYYGINKPIDYKAARDCALAETITSVKKEFSGDRILMMIYANGFGVKKNLDYATRLACRAGGEPRELEKRISHLQRLKTKKENKPFEFCDDVSSEDMMAACAKLATDIEEIKRSQ